MREERQIAEDEARRLRQHESIKREVRDEVHGEIRRVTDREESPDAARLRGVAHDLKQRAIGEVTATESELARAKRAARAAQVIDYCFTLVYGLVGLMFFLDLVGAREWSGFKQFMNLITAPLLLPFKGLMPDPSAGSFQLRISYLMALLVYALAHFAVRGFFRLFVYRKTSV
jgi:hypothetical protein